MTYLLDTNVCIKYLNGKSETIRKHLGNESPHNLSICSIVKAE